MLTRTLSTLLGASVATVVFAAPSYRVIDLGPLPPGNLGSTGVGLNSRGDVVGFGPIQGVLDRALLWPRGQAVANCGLLPGTVESIGTTINEIGEVAGYCFDTTQTVYKGFVRSLDGTLTAILDLPGGEELTIPYSVNSSGVVVGIVGTAAGYRPMRWTRAGGTEEIGPLLGIPEYGTCRHISEDGTIVGGYTRSGRQRPFLWHPGTGLRELPDLGNGATSTLAVHRSASGWVVGRTTTASGTTGIVWRPDGSAVSMGDLPGGPVYSSAEGANSAGVVVGVSQDAVGLHGTYWTQATGLVNMDSLLEPGSRQFRIIECRGVNEEGTIVGSCFRNGSYTACLLVRVPSKSLR
jgi:uncharacterized membrane protein